MVAKLLDCINFQNHLDVKNIILKLPFRNRVPTTLDEHIHSGTFVPLLPLASDKHWLAERTWGIYPSIAVILKDKAGAEIKTRSLVSVPCLTYQVPLFKLYWVHCLPNRENRTILSLNRLLVRVWGGWGTRFTKGPYKMPAERNNAPWHQRIFFMWSYMITFRFVSQAPHGTHPCMRLITAWI